MSKAVAHTHSWNNDVYFQWWDVCFFFSSFFDLCFLAVAVKCGKLMFNWTNQVLFLLFVFTAMHQPAWSRLKLLEAPSSPDTFPSSSFCCLQSMWERDETSGTSKSGNRTRINGTKCEDNANWRRPLRQQRVEHSSNIATWTGPKGIWCGSIRAWVIPYPVRSRKCIALPKWLSFRPWSRAR